jgi:membrane-bound inhibitor of C-type lysozyme
VLSDGIGHSLLTPTESPNRETPMTNQIIPLLAIMMLAAPLSAAQAATATYQCSDGSTLTASFSPPGAGYGRVVITGPGGRVALQQQPSADGGRYANGRMEFWIKGNGATLTREGRSETCHTR